MPIIVIASHGAAKSGSSLRGLESTLGLTSLNLYFSCPQGNPALVGFVPVINDLIRNSAPVLLDQAMSTNPSDGLAFFHSMQHAVSSSPNSASFSPTFLTFPVDDRAPTPLDYDLSPVEDGWSVKFGFTNGFWGEVGHNKVYGYSPKTNTTLKQCLVDIRQDSTYTKFLNNPKENLAVIGIFCRV